MFCLFGIPGSRSIPSLQGALISLSDHHFEVNGNDVLLVVNAFLHIGADDCSTHGDPVDANADPTLRKALLADNIHVENTFASLTQFFDYNTNWETDWSYNAQHLFSLPLENPQEVKKRIVAEMEFILPPIVPFEDDLQIEFEEGQSIPSIEHLLEAIENSQSATIERKAETIKEHKVLETKEEQKEVEESSEEREVEEIGSIHFDIKQIVSNVDNFATQKPIDSSAAESRKVLFSSESVSRKRKSIEISHLEAELLPVNSKLELKFCNW